MRDETRARVREVMAELNYVPDGAAQSLSRRRKEIIGLVNVERTCSHFEIEYMSVLFPDAVLHGVEARIRECEWSLLIAFLEDGDERSFERLMSLSGKVDGLLIAEGVVPSKDLARLAERLPVVVLAGSPAERGADVVTSDNRAGSAALARHLIEEHGRREIFHVDGPPSAPDARERRLALEKAVRAHPEARIVGRYPGRFSAESGQEAAEKLLAGSRDDLPDAVVCANDQMAIGVLNHFARAGVEVPERVAVVGFDDIYPGNLTEPSLTTVHQPMHLLGERACTRLLERIAQPGLAGRSEVLPTELVLRRSCGCPPSPGRRTELVPVASASGGRGTGTGPAPRARRASRSVRS